VVVTDERRTFFGYYLGEVTNREDPEGRDRIKLRIPGLIEPECPDWAVPLGVPQAGTAQRGGPSGAPAKGATVAVIFEQGEIDKPGYLTGPWGAPGNVSDAPTGSAIEGDDRQNAVIEDPEWLIERDSRTSAQVYRVKHKASGVEVVILGTDRIELVRTGATEAFVVGTTYRAAEAAYLSSFVSAVQGLVAALNLFEADATFKAAFTTLAGSLTSAATTLSTALTPLTTNDMQADPTAHLSTKLFGE
jgi:hypothetical protein